VKKLSKTKKYLVSTTLALAAAVGSAQAERHVMITHTQGQDPFWPVVERGARDAVKETGVQFEYVFNPSGDMADMARLIETAAASQPDGMVISVPDVGAVGPAIKSAVASGVPVITINSGIEHYKALGALMHVGQDERQAGQSAGERAKREGVKGKAICLIHEAFNTAMVTRCEGYASGVGQAPSMVEVSVDMVQARTRVAAALQADPSITAIHSVGADICEAADKALTDLGADLYHSCQDLTSGVINLIKQGRVAFSVDQQPYFQGYMPIVLLHLYNTNAGLLPGSNVVSGPAFVDRSNAEAVANRAGVTR